MNKYLMMSAAALISTAGNISSPAVATTTIGYSGFCDGLSINKHPGGIISGQHLFTGCYGGSSYNLTYFSDVDSNKELKSLYGVKRLAIIDAYNTLTFAYGYGIQFPIANGNHWIGFVCSGNGVTCWEYNAGTYFVGYSADKAKQNAWSKPTRTMLEAKIGERKS